MSNTLNWTDNTIEITEMSDAALDYYTRTMDGEDYVCFDHLTVEDRLMVAKAMGLDLQFVRSWILGGRKI